MMPEKMSFTNIKDNRDRLEAIGWKMEEEDMVVITLKDLPKSYEHFMDA